MKDTDDRMVINISEYDDVDIDKLFEGLSREAQIEIDNQHTPTAKKYAMQLDETQLEVEILGLMKDMCPDFAPYNYLKKYDLYKGSLFGGTNIYYKYGKKGKKGMVTTKTNIRKYDLEQFPYNFESECDHNGTPELGWSGDMLLELLKYLKSTNTTQQGQLQTADHSGKYDDIFPESSLPSNYYEGAVQQVTVNKYERSSIARQRCIDYNGTKCFVCGMNFEDTYGEIGKYFIHVHHVVPLNEIGKEYVVDYKKDLIPVCPNCHAMLHRKVNDNYISWEVLRDKLKQGNI